jgi:HlyD family secretion protein
MRRFKIPLILFFTFAGLFVVFRGAMKPTPIEVELATVDRGVVEETVTNSRAGTVKARRRAKLSPEIGGVVAELPFREGETAPAGALVLRLEDSIQRANLLVTERELAAATANLAQPCLESERGQREMKRVRGLVDGGIVSADRLDEVESAAGFAGAACSAARTAVDRAQASVELARAQLAKTVIRAPFPGVVADLATEIGEYATPSPPAVPVPPAIDLLDPASIYVSAPMDEVDSARIKPGLAARLTVDSHRGRDFPGRVLRIAPFVVDREEQNRTVEIEVDFDDKTFAASLLPGTSADVEAILARREDVVRVPTPCVIEGKRALVLRAGKLEEVSLELGLRNWQFAEVLSGLAPGDRVVRSFDQPAIKAGALAHGKGEAPEAGAAGK